MIAALLRGRLDHDIRTSVHGVRVAATLHMIQPEELPITMPRSKHLPEWFHQEIELLYRAAERAWAQVRGKNPIEAQRLLGHRLSSALGALMLGGSPADADHALSHEVRETATRGSNAEVSRLQCVHDEQEPSPYAVCACALEKARERTRSVERWAIDDTGGDDEDPTEEEALHTLHEELIEDPDIDWLDVQRDELASELLETLDLAEDAGLDACALDQLEDGLATRTIAPVARHERHRATDTHKGGDGQRARAAARHYRPIRGRERRALRPQSAQSARTRRRRGGRRMSRV